MKLATFHDTFQEVESSYTLQSENGNTVVQCWYNTQCVKMRKFMAYTQYLMMCLLSHIQ